MNVALHPPRQINVISLCTGGGGLDLGVELAIPDACPVVLVEREAFAVARLVSAMEEGLMAPVPVWSDVRTFNGRPWRGNVDGLIGGIPCQPHSVAGKRLGAEDDRDLWADARRIIVQSGAWLCLIENVAGMLSTGGAERVWRDLRRLGFEVEAGLFTSAEVGAPHERKRIFILAVADAGCMRDKRRRNAGELSCPPANSEGRTQERQRHGHTASDGRANVGHTDDAGLEGRGRGELRECAGERATRETGGALVDTACDGRREGRPEPIFRSGRDAAAGDGGAMADAIRRGHDGIAQDALGRQIKRNATERAERDDLPLYPPGPNDIDAWREIIERTPQFEPAVRRMADGMAGRLDRLRMLGNGVNPLQAAYAVRTLCSRLARRSAGAAELLRMMEAAE